MPNPINPTTPEARALARTLLTAATHGALATHGAPAPLVTRVAVTHHENHPLTLVSTLSPHTQALQSHPDCSLLLGEPGPKGDPLTHPRMTLICRAEPADKTALRDHWLAALPKSKLYYDFADFLLFRLTIQAAHLNGGFGKAFHLTADDLCL